MTEISWLFTLSTATLHITSASLQRAAHIWDQLFRCKEGTFHQLKLMWLISKRQERSAAWLQSVFAITFQFQYFWWTFLHSLPITSSYKTKEICGTVLCYNTEHFIQCSFIVASLVYTYIIFTLSNQCLDRPHLWSEKRNYLSFSLISQTLFDRNESYV